MNSFNFHGSWPDWTETCLINLLRIRLQSGKGARSHMDIISPSFYPHCRLAEHSRFTSGSPFFIAFYFLGGALLAVQIIINLVFYHVPKVTHELCRATQHRRWYFEEQTRWRYFSSGSWRGWWRTQRSKRRPSKSLKSALAIIGKCKILISLIYPTSKR